MKAGRTSTQGSGPKRAPAARRRVADAPERPHRADPGAARPGRQRSGRPSEGRRETRRDARRPHEPGSVRRGPQTAPVARPVDVPTRAKNATQAKARAKARKAKAPKVIRPPLRERLRARLRERVWDRLVARLVGVDLRPQALLARVPFVVLVIGSLGLGLGFTLWLSTDAAGRSYEIGAARALNEALVQQKEALERDVLQAESAPALAEAARNLGMIPSKDTAHLVQDPAGNWVVIGQPKPAEGVPPPPLNTKLPDPKPPARPKPPSPPVGAEVPVRVAIPGAPGAPGLEVPVRLPSANDLSATSSPAGIPAMPGLPSGAEPAFPALPGAPGLSLPVVPIGPGSSTSAPLADHGLPALPPNAVIPALEPEGFVPPPAPEGFVPPSAPDGLVPPPAPGAPPPLAPGAGQ